MAGAALVCLSVVLVGFSGTAAAQATGRLIAVGHYDPVSQSMEIAPWDDIKDLLQQKKE